MTSETKDLLAFLTSGKKCVYTVIGIPRITSYNDVITLYWILVSLLSPGMNINNIKVDPGLLYQDMATSFL